MTSTYIIYWPLRTPFSPAMMSTAFFQCSMLAASRISDTSGISQYTPYTPLYVQDTCITCLCLISTLSRSVHLLDRFWFGRELQICNVSVTNQTSFVMYKYTLHLTLIKPVPLTTNAINIHPCGESSLVGLLSSSIDLRPSSNFKSESSIF